VIHLVKGHSTILAARQWLIGGFDDQYGGFREVEGVTPVGIAWTKTARQLCHHGEASGSVQVIQPSAQTPSDGRIKRVRRSLIVVAQRAQVVGRKD
jgi:hypothetical protein